MRSIAFSSHELSKSGRIIERMYEFCQPEQDIGQDRQLRRYIQQSKKAIGECTAAIEEINNRFDKWSDMTKCLHLALLEAIANEASEAEIIESKITGTESNLRMTEREQRRQEIRLLETRYRLEDTQQRQAKYIEHAVAQGVFLASSGIFSAATATMSTIGILLGVAATMFNYSVLQTNMSNLLFSKKTSIADVMKAINDALYHVKQLQRQVRIFMQFLKQISTLISHNVDKSESIYNTLEHIEDLVKPSIKEILFNDNFEMRARFVFASRASGVYNNISTQYILPIIDRVDSLCLFHSETNDEIDGKLAELEALRKKMVSATEECVIDMQEDLRNDFDNMTRTAASRFDPMVEMDGEDVAYSNDESDSEYADANQEL
ncbi:hypothetical protein H0G86_013167 [Trichoderma simmonsii]|uniref:Uncharacterized protein n=1 Tax=Trichoderma simmonsii TaxID=1491479 RepID=A0A8G0PRL5_9HYPO|nr:hypothetical protein H0G86_013167 [Trichoderma simmonsii]